MSTSTSASPQLPLIEAIESDVKSDLPASQEIDWAVLDLDVALQHPVQAPVAQHPAAAVAQHPVQAPVAQHPPVVGKCIKRLRRLMDADDESDDGPLPPKRAKTITMETALNEYNLFKNKTNKCFATGHSMMVADVCSQFAEQGVIADPISIGKTIATSDARFDMKEYARNIHAKYIQDQYPHLKIRKALLARTRREMRARVTTAPTPQAVANGGPAEAQAPTAFETAVAHAVAMAMRQYAPHNY